MQPLHGVSVSMSRDFARHLRKNMTDAERRLWGAIRYRQLGNWKFRRQAPIGSYIVDFVCFERKVIVELDGSQHVEQHDYDAERTAWLNSQGFRVVRLWNHQVMEELDDALALIWQELGATVNLPH